MQKMAATATALDMAVLVEAHNEEELKAALNLSDSLIGINNRNLHTFQTTLQTTLELLPLAKTANRTLISESGIKTAADVQLLQKAGVDAFLIGEACMRAEDPGAALKDYLFKHKKPAITDNQGRQGSINGRQNSRFRGNGNGRKQRITVVGNGVCQLR